MEVMRIAEQYFQRLLHATDPLKAVGALAGFWESRGHATNGRLGMSAPEQHVTMVLIYVGEVGNGGHTQFFSNRGGNVVSLVRAALRETALAELETILESAAAIFPGAEIPVDRAAVEQLLRAMTEDELELLGRLDQQAWSLAPDARLLEYMREHEGDLLRPERGLAVAGARHERPSGCSVAAPSG
jgi:Domain of unknown function (DUF4375)